MSKDQLFIDKVLRALGAMPNDVDYLIVMAKALPQAEILTRKELVELIEELY
jgi:hypothetical protein